MAFWWFLLFHNPTTDSQFYVLGIEGESPFSGYNIFIWPSSSRQIKVAESLPHFEFLDYFVPAFQSPEWFAANDTLSIRV